MGPLDDNKELDNKSMDSIVKFVADVRIGSLINAGRHLTHALPTEHSAANMVRRVLRAIRDEQRIHANQNFNIPITEPEVARIQARDVTDYPDYEQIEFRRSDNLPGLVEIVKLEPDKNGDGDAINDPDYEPSSARSRGNVLRKRKNEKKPRSRSRGRRTRSQTAIENKQKVEVD